MSQAPIVVHHVGARYGNFPFAPPEGLRDQVRAVLYDADADCIAGLAGTANAIALPVCLADRNGEAEFRITANPSGSSLLEPSAGPDGFFIPMLGLDWDLEAGRAVVERRRIATRTLDSLLAERPDLPAPDVLTLDAQGGELLILKGAERALREHVAALVVEVQFQPLYDGAPSFDDLSRFLAERGFQFAAFANPIPALPVAAPLGRRTGGFQVAADAVFLRRLDRTPAGRPAQALAFAALTFGHLEYALAALAQGGAEDDAGWAGFLRGLAKAAAATPAIQPPLAPQSVPGDRAAAFRAEADPARWPAYWDLSAWRGEGLEALFDTADTPLEAYLRGHGFAGLADEVNLRRRDQAWRLHQLLEAST